MDYIYSQRVEELQSHLKIKFSDYVQPDPKDGVAVSFKLPSGDSSAFLFVGDATVKVG